MTTVPVPAPEMTIGRQGHYAGAASRLVAFGADVGASWGAYTLGVALINAAVKLVTGHSFTLTNHQTLALIISDRLGVLVLHLPMGGERQDARHGHLRIAGSHGGGPAYQRPPGGAAHHRARITLFLTLGIGFLGIIFQRERRGLDDFIAGTAVVYDWDARAARLRWIARKEGPLLVGSRDAAAASPTPKLGGRLGRRASPPTMPRMSFAEVSRPHPQVAVVTLNRPERMNAMAFDVMIPFRDALREIGSDNECGSSSSRGPDGDSARGPTTRTPGRCPTWTG